MLSKILNAVLVLLIIGLVSNYLYRLPKFDDGELAPTFEAERIDGSLFKLTDMKGSYVLLDFWGSWCAPCRRENPELVDLHSKYSKEKFIDAEGFSIVSVAIETNENSWKRAIERDGLAWSNHIVQLDRFKSPVAVLYGVKEIPTKYLIGPDGNIISVNQSPIAISKYLSQKKN